MSSSQSTRVSNQSPSKVPKATWNDDNTKVLLQILSEEISEGNRVNGVYNAADWRNICNKFQSRTNLPYTKNQLKNRSSQLRSIYTKWVKLSDRATGLGFDIATGTITANDGWWATQAQEDPEVLKWRTCPPKFLELMFQCYAGTCATGKYAYVPSYTPPAYAATSNQPPLNESETDTPTVRPTFVSRSVGPDLPGNQAQGNNPPNSTFSPPNKRQRDSNPRKSSGAELSASVGEIASILRDKQVKIGASLEATDPELEEIDAAYKLLNEQPYIELASDFHLKAINVLRDKIWRHTFITLISKFPSEAQVKWFKSNFC